MTAPAQAKPVELGVEERLARLEDAICALIHETAKTQGERVLHHKSLADLFEEAKARKATRQAEAAIAAARAVVDRGGRPPTLDERLAAQATRKW